jgi:3-deoxy-7-phosphoheptulonate synthase
VTLQSDAWRDRPAAQQPEWGDAAALAGVVAQLAAMPPLVFAGEADLLRERLAAVARGEAFLLQGGDCAETFAGQHADGHPRQGPHAAADGGRADLRLERARREGRSARRAVREAAPAVGSRLATASRSRPTAAMPSTACRSPQRPVRPTPPGCCASTTPSAATLNLLRAFTHGGYADLRQVHEWNKGFFRDSGVMARYELMAARHRPGAAFMAACGADPRRSTPSTLYTSHEALLLDYEAPLTRIDSRTGDPYDCSAHFVWIGRADPPARRRARRLGGRHPQPDRRQAGTDRDRRRRARADRRARPAARAGAPDVHHAHGRAARAGRCPPWWRR